MTITCDYCGTDENVVFEAEPDPRSGYAAERACHECIQSGKTVIIEEGTAEAGDDDD